MVLMILGDTSMTPTFILIAVRSAISCAMSCGTTMSAELFPSYMRQSAVGTTSAISSAFSVLSPYVGGPLADFWAPFPSLIFGAMGLLAGLLVFLVPETKGKPMPQTLEEAISLDNPKNRNERSRETEGNN